MKLFRKILAAEQSEVFNINSFNFTVLNMGSADIQVNFDAVADENSLVIPGKMGRNFSFIDGVENIHVYSKEGSDVQIDNAG